MEELGGFNIRPRRLQADVGRGRPRDPEDVDPARVRGPRGQVLLDAAAGRGAQAAAEAASARCGWRARSPPSFETAGKYGLGVLCFTIGEPGELAKTHRVVPRGDQEPRAGRARSSTSRWPASPCCTAGRDDAAARHRGGEAAIWYFAKLFEYFGEIAAYEGYRDYRKRAEDAKFFYEEKVQGEADQEPRRPGRHLRRRPRHLHRHRQAVPGSRASTSSSASSRSARSPTRTAWSPSACSARRSSPASSEMPRRQVAT